MSKKSEPRFNVGDKVFYFGEAPFTEVFDGVIELLHPDGHTYTVRFLHRSLFIQESELHAFTPLDPDVQKMNWETLQREVMRWRSAARYLLTQQGDDLCWRDWYLLFRRLLPEGIDQDNTRTLPPKRLFLKNCERYCESLSSHSTGTPYYPLGYDDKDQIIAKLQEELFFLKDKLKASEVNVGEEAN